MKLLKLQGNNSEDKLTSFTEKKINTSIIHSKLQSSKDSKENLKMIRKN